MAGEVLARKVALMAHQPISARSLAAAATALVACLVVSSPASASTTASPNMAADPHVDVVVAKKKKRKKKRKSKKQRAAEKKAAEEAAKKAADEEAAKKAAEEAAAAKAAEEAAQKAAADEAAQKAAEEAAAAKAAEEAAQKEAAAKAAREAELAQAQEAKGLDARVRRLSDALARDLKRLPGDHRTQTFAVLPLDDLDDGSKQKQLGLVVSDLLTTNLVRDHRLRLVERARLKSVLNEVYLAETGLTSGNVTTIGEMTNAESMVLGGVAETGDVFTVSARVVNADGEVVVTHEAKIPRDELIALSENAVVLRSRTGGLFRSLLIPGFGQLYNKEPGKALIAGGTVGALAVGTVATLGTAGAYHLAYLNTCPGNFGPVECPSDFKQRADTLEGLRSTANVLYSVSAGLAAVTAVAWGINAVDAYFSGVDVDSVSDATVE